MKYLILFIVFLLYVKTADLNLENTFLNNLSTETEFESDLIKLLTKIQQKKIENKKNNINKDLVTVKINNVYDLQEYIYQIQKLKSYIIKEKDKSHKEMLELSEKLNKQLKINKENLNKLKDKYDSVIEKTNNLNKGLNEKKTELILTQTQYDNTKTEFENINDKFLNKVAQSGKKLALEQTKIFTDFETKISNLDLNLNQRNTLQENILKLKEKFENFSIELKNMKKTKLESSMDEKLFKIIDNHLSDYVKEYKSSYLNSTIAITSLEKIIKDTTNTNKLEGEKSLQNDLYKVSSKTIQDMQKIHENLQNEIKDLMKRKNKIQENLNTKDIEINLKINKLKSEITGTHSSIKEVENQMLNNFLLKNELRLKNLILILNNLLLQLKSGKKYGRPEEDGLLNNLLFGSKILDVNNGINDNIIEEINSSIIKSK